MRKPIFTLILLVPLLAFSQKKGKAKEVESDTTVQIPFVNDAIIYSEVVQVDSTSATDLYQRAKRFFVDAYKSANDVIQMDDEKNGEVTGKGNFKVFFDRGALISGVSTSVKHTISIYVKDGRYKYEIKDLSVNYYESGSRIGTSYISGHEVNSPLEGFAKSKMKMHKRYIEAVDAEIRATINLLKAAMLKKPETKKSDW
ncbi:DUF4468 domain-containing protein [Chitinophagaceae bacterium LB-8]|uniref:DUF4468 domain-containing protein n=1 Tax=Paraflavisolibacter caeni TaxID=2982496 RepID=A0A9X3B6C0_9BACT|nr:DUF4468 domain-containing protein [Paraflavisolibacter caeni]MCU7547790.1 DUF4468 domain-containing protein [Paraflavisolibacter caeni]